MIDTVGTPRWSVLWSILATTIALATLWSTAWHQTEDCIAALSLTGVVGVALIARVGHHPSDRRQR